MLAQLLPHNSIFLRVPRTLRLLARMDARGAEQHPGVRKSPHRDPHPPAGRPRIPGEGTAPATGPAAKPRHLRPQRLLELEDLLDVLRLLLPGAAAVPVLPGHGCSAQPRGCRAAGSEPSGGFCFLFCRGGSGCCCFFFFFLLLRLLLLPFLLLLLTLPARRRFYFLRAPAGSASVTFPGLFPPNFLFPPPSRPFSPLLRASPLPPRSRWRGCPVSPSPCAPRSSCAHRRPGVTLLPD